MTNELILVSIHRGIGTITLNRPEKRNAMNGQLVRELLQALATMEEHADVKVLMIKGNGDHFCAGADISWMQKMSMVTEDENYDDAQSLSDLLYRLHTFQKPTIVLAHGTTVGGGLGLVSACDIAIAANTALFGFSEVKIGIVPSVVSPYVIAAIGCRMAHYYFLTGERFGAEVAQRIHLVHHVSEESALTSVGEALARTLLENSPKAMAAAKQLIRTVAHENITETLSQKTAQQLAEMRVSPEAQEGLTAFLEKRKPRW
jgi:methylglutaconyl-CoA hydratase